MIVQRERGLMREVYCVRLKYALLLFQHSSIPSSFHCFLLQVWLLERLRRRGETKRGAEGSGVGWFCLSSVVDGSSFRGNGGEGGVGGTSGGTNEQTYDRLTCCSILAPRLSRPVP